MKIYLSNYWRKSSIFIVCLSAIITVATAVFCIQSYDEEDYILIIGALFFVILSFYLQLNALKLLDYVEVSNNQFIMCSVIDNDIPEDICFYRNGKLWFATISHEKIAFAVDVTKADLTFFKENGIKSYI